MGFWPLFEARLPGPFPAGVRTGLPPTAGSLGVAGRVLFPFAVVHFQL